MSNSIRGMLATFSFIMFWPSVCYMKLKKKIIIQKYIYLLFCIDVKRDLWD
jgi:hypothetical protein